MVRLKASFYVHIFCMNEMINCTGKKFTAKYWPIERLWPSEIHTMCLRAHKDFYMQSLGTHGRLSKKFSRTSDQDFQLKLFESARRGHDSVVPTKIVVQQFDGRILIG